MTTPPSLAPCFTSHLFRPLLAELLNTLRGLEADDWQRQTLAPRWKVRDVVAHLLDVDLRRIAVYRDGHFPPMDRPPANDREITDLVNRLNAGGVAFGARLSTRLLTELLEITGAWVADLNDSLPPHGEATFAVSWAGEGASENWMDIGREYTERWHHQMQIRDATSRPLLLEPTWSVPLFDLSVRALPHAYRDTAAPAGSAITMHVGGDTSRSWTLIRREHEWQMVPGAANAARTVVRLSADQAWRMLYNAPYDRTAVRIEGDVALAAPLLNTRSVIV